MKKQQNVINNNKVLLISEEKINTKSKLQFLSISNKPTCDTSLYLKLKLPLSCMIILEWKQDSLAMSYDRKIRYFRMFYVSLNILNLMHIVGHHFEEKYG